MHKHNVGLLFRMQIKLLLLICTYVATSYYLHMYIPPLDILRGYLACLLGNETKHFSTLIALLNSIFEMDRYIICTVISRHYSCYLGSESIVKMSSLHYIVGSDGGLTYLCRHLKHVSKYHATFNTMASFNHF